MTPQHQILLQIGVELVFILWLAYYFRKGTG